MWINIAGIQIARRSKRFPQIAGRTNDWDMIAIERVTSIRDSPSCQWAEAGIFFGRGARTVVGGQWSMRTIRSAFPLALLFLLASAVSPAQNNCPEGFRYLGTLSGYGTSVERFDARQELTLPPNTTLDDSYQQEKVRATNGKNGVHSSMRPQDVPKGFYLVPLWRKQQFGSRTGVGG
jgi:hypothetical protein